MEKVWDLFKILIVDESLSSTTYRELIRIILHTYMGVFILSFSEYCTRKNASNLRLYLRNMLGVVTKSKMFRGVYL